MWGDCEWKATGSLKTYDCVDRLPDITVAVLLTCGRYDEATPEATAWYQQRFPHARLRIFEDSAHMAHFEEREEYLAALREFLEEFRGQ